MRGTLTELHRQAEFWRTMLACARILGAEDMERQAADLWLRLSDMYRAIETGLMHLAEASAGTGRG